MSEDNNRVIVSGKVVNLPILDHTLYGEEFYTFDISIPRLSGAVDILPLTVSNRLMGNRMPQVGDHVTVRGQLRSYNKQIDGINRLIITIFGKQFRYEAADYDYINDIELVGYICKPVIYRTTPFMREIADILVAVNRSYGKSDYLPCIAWGRNAHFAGTMDVGTVIKIEGRVQSRVYQKQITEDEVVERTAFEVSCSVIELVSDNPAGNAEKE
ncbi:MAG: single-stranded DNA-binding protein [Clostridiales bacterium]|jgi:hypothetical protein|nr:single-stranded DNA-binding protein [Clostridiales bacterium]